jgi:hypothetical protein
LEVLSYNGNEIPSGLHYGYSELGIIRHALQQSFELAQSQHFIKVTGRLFFPGVPALLRQLRPDVLAAVDARMNFRRAPRIPFVATQLMLFDRDFYLRHLSDGQTWLRPEHGKTHIENFFYARLSELASDPRIYMRFPCNVEPRGYGATNATKYHSFSSRGIAMVRALSRRVAPDIWL